MSETQRVAPAGWYPDAEKANTVRYWDGHAWTEQYAPTTPSPVVRQKFSGVAITSLVLTVVGFFAIFGSIVAGIGLTGFGLLFAIAGLADTKRRGRGYAVAGLLVGVAGVMNIIFYFIRM